MRWIACLGLVVSMAGCGSWKGNGNDEVLPDVLGMTTGVKRSEGVPSNTLHEHADQNLANGPLVFFSEPHNQPASPSGEAGKLNEAPAAGALPPGMHRAPSGE